MAKKNDGEVTYELRVDDSNLDADLNESEKKIEKFAKKTAEQESKIEKEKSESIKDEQKKVTKNHKKEKENQEKSSQQSAKTLKQLAKNVASDVKESASKAVSKVSNTIEVVKHPIKNVSSFSKQKAKDIKESFTSAFSKTREKAVSGMEKVAKSILHPVKTAKTAASEMKEHFSNAFEGMKESAAEAGKTMAKATAVSVGGGLVAAAGTIAGVGVAAIKSANDVDKAMNQYIASTGKGTEETERYKSVMESIYANNYGDSFEDIGEAMASVSQNLGDLDDSALQSVTESAFALRDTFGYDIPESTRAAKAMVDNFGISGDEAMSLIAAGAQDGLDYSGELIDSISEYSVQFAKVGLDANDMFNIFQKGAESGAFNLDKVGDAVKEMAIRVVDGSDTTVAGFEAIGLNADDMAKKFAAGGDTAKAAFNETISALAAMEDPIAQNTAGVNLFGTMWEDLGADAVTALAGIEDGAYDTGEAMKSIKDIKYNDIGSVFEGLKRSLEVLIVPLGEQLIPLLAELIDDSLPLLQEALPPLISVVSDVISAMMPAIEDVLPSLMDSLGEIGEPLMELASEILPILADAFTGMVPLVADLVGDILPILTELLGMLLPPLVEIISALLPPLTELLGALMPIFSAVISVLEPILQLFIQLLAPIVSLISDGLTPLVTALVPIVNVIASLLIPAVQLLGNIFATRFAGMLTDATSVIKNITNILRNLVDFIKNVFTGNWRAAWQNVVEIFKNLVAGLGNIFKRPLNFIIDGINGFINGLNQIKIPDWVPAVGGKGFHISNIPRLKIGMDYVPNDMFPAYLDEGEWVLTKEEANLLRSFGGLEGMIGKLDRSTRESVNVTVQGGKGTEIDYDRLGRATADALINAGVGFKCDERVFARLIKDLIDYV